MAVERSQEHILGRALAVVPIPVSAIAHPSSRPTPTDGFALTVVLIDAATGLPYVASGGGGGGSAQMTATAAAPTYVEGSSTNPLSSNLTGDLRVIAKQNGTWTVGLSAGSAAIGSVIATGNVAHDAADSGNPVKVGGRATATAPAAVAAGDRSDFFTDTFGSQRVIIADSAGAVLDYTTPALVAGGTAADAALTAAPVTVGGRAANANPTAMSANGDVVNAQYDLYGRQITRETLRETKSVATTTITSSTTETTIVAAVASTFNDIFRILINNTSDTATTVTIRDGTVGTIRWVFVVGAGETKGFSGNVSGATKQAAVNTNWTAQCGTSVASVVITTEYVANI